MRDDNMQAAFGYSSDSYCMYIPYRIVHNAHALGTGCFDALKHIHHMLSFESLQLSVEDHKHTTPSTAITALVYNTSKPWHIPNIFMALTYT